MSSALFDSIILTNLYIDKNGPKTKTQYMATLQANSMIHTELYKSVVIQCRERPGYMAPICDLGVCR